MVEERQASANLIEVWGHIEILLEEAIAEIDLKDWTEFT